MPKKTKKQVFLKISMPSSILSTKGIVSLPVQYGRLVKLNGAKTIVVVCKEYDLPATYSLSPSGTATWEGYCSDGKPALKKLVGNGLVIPKSKLRQILDNVCFDIDNRINNRLG